MWISYFRTDRYLDEDWRTGRKISTCDSDDGRQTPKVSSHTVPLSSANSNSATHRSSPTGYGNAQPGVLILPNDTNQSSPNQTTTASTQGTGHQQQRTLFDPNNPHKPIIITSPGSRAAVQRYNQLSFLTIHSSFMITSTAKSKHRLILFKGQWHASYERSSISI